MFLRLHVPLEALSRQHPCTHHAYFQFVLWLSGRQRQGLNLLDQLLLWVLIQKFQHSLVQRGLSLYFSGLLLLLLEFVVKVVGHVDLVLVHVLLLHRQLGLRHWLHRRRHRRSGF